MSKEKVPVQKGTMISNPPTSKQMPYKEKVAEREQQQRDTRRGQTLDYVTPKQKKN